jgi:hypothetical protein
MRTKFFALIILLLMNITSVFSFESQSLLNLNISTAFTPNNEEVQSKLLSPFVSYEKHYEDQFYINFGIGISYLMLDREGFGEYSSIDVSNLIAGVGYSFEDEEISLKSTVNFSIGVPIAFYKSSNIDDKKLTEFNYTSVISAQGWSNPYPWLINTCPFILSYMGSLQLSKFISIDYTLKPSFLLSMNDRPSGLGLQNMIKFGVNVRAYNAIIGFNNYYSTINLENNDHSQSSLLGGASFRSESFLFEISVGLNLDAPNGILYDPPKTNWGISFGLIHFIH